jgi:hypothetical protein
LWCPAQVQCAFPPKAWQHADTLSGADSSCSTSPCNSCCIVCLALLYKLMRPHSCRSSAHHLDDIMCTIIAESPAAGMYSTDRHRAMRAGGSKARALPPRVPVAAPEGSALAW